MPIYSVVSYDGIKFAGYQHHFVRSHTDLNRYLQAFIKIWVVEIVTSRVTKDSSTVGCDKISLVVRMAMDPQVWVRLFN